MKPIKASPLHGALATVLGASLEADEQATASVFDADLECPTRCGSFWPRTTW